MVYVIFDEDGELMVVATTQTVAEQYCIAHDGCYFMSAKLIAA